MGIKPVATTEEELTIYNAEENLARLYERRELEYEKLLIRLEDVSRAGYYTGLDPNLALDICEFLLREVQFKKLV